MPRLVPIADPADPRIASYIAVRERDLVGRDGGFIAEGEVVLRVLLTRSRFRPESLLVLDRRIDGLAPLLADLPDDVPVYAVPQEVLDRVVGFHIHRGILALGRRGADLDAAALLDGCPARALVVALIGVANHDNVGGIFRNAAAFGADAVLIDGATCDPLYRKAIRVSVGGSLVVPFARVRNPDDLLRALAAARFDVIALSPRGAEPLAALRRPDRAALLLGAEGPGLPADILARTRTARIPMAGGFDSLNVATASGIALHHLAFGGTAPAPAG